MIHELHGAEVEIIDLGPSAYRPKRYHHVRRPNFTEEARPPQTPSAPAKLSIEQALMALLGMGVCVVGLAVLAAIVFACGGLLVSLIGQMIFNP